MSRCMIKMKLLNHPYANQRLPFETGVFQWAKG